MPSAQDSEQAALEKKKMEEKNKFRIWARHAMPNMLIDVETKNAGQKKNFYSNSFKTFLKFAKIYQLSDKKQATGRLSDF